MLPTADEYNDMKAFLRFFAERFQDRRIASAQDRPLARLARQERESPERAPAALRMAVNNCMEMSASWPLSQVAALDVEMHAKGLLSVSHVRCRVWGRHAAMLERGQVRSGDELAVAQGVLADASLLHGLPDGERQVFQSMVQAGEARRARPPGGAPRPGPVSRARR